MPAPIRHDFCVLKYIRTWRASGIFEGRITHESIGKKLLCFIVGNCVGIEIISKINFSRDRLYMLIKIISA